MFRLPRKLKKWFKTHVKPGGILYSTYKHAPYIVTRNKKGQIKTLYRPSYNQKLSIASERLLKHLEWITEFGPIINFASVRDTGESIHTPDEK